VQLICRWQDGAFLMLGFIMLLTNLPMAVVPPCAGTVPWFHRRDGQPFLANVVPMHRDSCSRAPPSLRGDRSNDCSVIGKLIAFNMELRMVS